MPDWLAVTRRRLYVHIQYVNQTCKQKCVAKEAGEWKKRRKLIEDLRQGQYCQRCRQNLNQSIFDKKGKKSKRKTPESSPPMYTDDPRLEGVWALAAEWRPVPIDAKLRPPPPPPDLGEFRSWLTELRESDRLIPILVQIKKEWCNKSEQKPKCCQHDYFLTYWILQEICTNWKTVNIAMINLLLATLNKPTCMQSKKWKAKTTKSASAWFDHVLHIPILKLTLLLTGYVGNRPTGSTCPKRPDVGILIDVDGFRSWTSGRLVGAFSA